MHTAEDADQRRLAGAVFSDQGMNFPGHDVEADVVESRRGAKALGDPTCPCGRLRHVHLPSGLAGLGEALFDLLAQDVAPDLAGAGEWQLLDAHQHLGELVVGDLPLEEGNDLLELPAPDRPSG